MNKTHNAILQGSERPFLVSQEQELQMKKQLWFSNVKFLADVRKKEACHIKQSAFSLAIPFL